MGAHVRNVQFGGYVLAMRSGRASSTPFALAAAPVDVGSRVGAVLRHRPFAWLAAAQVQSLIGDQIGRVALSVLVFNASSSPLLTAGVYGLTYAPAVLGGVLFGHVVDRLGRRTVLVAADLARALLFAVMATPAVPLWVVAMLVAVAVAVGSLFQAAAPAVVADLFTGPSLGAAMGVRTIVSQVGFLAGFAVGGVAVAGVGGRAALLVNAATFVLSACLLARGLRNVPAARRPAASRRGGAAGWTRIKAVFATTRLRELVSLAWLVGLWIVPEALATPYVAEHGGDQVSVGLLLASVPLGCVGGAVLLTRGVRASVRPAAARVMAIATGVPLIATGLGPPWWVAAGLWVLAGAGSAYQAQVVTELLEQTPSEQRGSVMGVVGGGLIAVQGAGAAFGGVLAEFTSAAAAVAIAGTVGTGLALIATARARGRAAQYSQP